MKKNLFFIFLIFTLFGKAERSFSQDTSLFRYLPLKIGNTWVYHGSSATIQCHGTWWYDRIRISGTTIVNGKTYFTVDFRRIYITGNCGGSISLFGNGAPIRVDSSSFNAYQKTPCNGSSESLVDSLGARLYDTSLSCGQKVICVNDTSFYNSLGVVKRTKAFKHGEGWESGEVQTYAMDIGLVSYYYYCGGTYQIGLQGCVIDGVVYGDTNIVLGLNTVSTEVPERFSLTQNYPNPFNPTTHIGFRIAESGLVRLTIFDALGREVQTLVNQELSPGTYEADFDGTKLPSGVYYYKLESGSYTETKKMILIK